MNPADPRAEALEGKSVLLPLVGRKIPIVLDDHVVLPDPESEDEKARFSTGFLKVTPAHDPNDWEIGQRHDLEIVNVMAPDGSISDQYGWDLPAGREAEQFLGMDRFEARKAIVEWFRDHDLLEKVVDYTHEVGHSYRSHVPIEPYLSDQWYVAVKQPIEKLDRSGTVENTDVPAGSLAGLALQPLMDGELKFIPARYANNYRNWLENLRDWPISRQLWWGHQIPIWSKPGRHALESTNALLTRTETNDEGQDITYACIAPGHEELEAKLETDGWTRDPDVLDTWFSSALWPFSTLGWPEQTDALATWYPGDVLCTAREIITLWVSRMVMMGQYCLGNIPFSDVFIHAMIQDGQGRKMSKTLGNGIDPLVVIDSHGADAMRFTLCSMTTQTQDVRMPVKTITLPDGREVNSSPKFDLGRNFCNKLWNASRFAMMNLDGAPGFEKIDPSSSLSDRWILSGLHRTIHEVTAAIDSFQYSVVADQLYHFVWDAFCDWYLEIAKARIQDGQNQPKAVLAWCLDVILRLLHPVAPYLTEAIWQKLNEIAPARGPGGAQAADLLIGAAWPTCRKDAIDPQAEADFDLLASLTREIRNARMTHNVPPRQKLDVIIEARDPSRDVIEDNLSMLQSVAALGEVSLPADTCEQPSGAAVVTLGPVKAYVLDIIDLQAEKQRLGKQAETLRSGIQGIRKKLDNEQFVTRAPAQVVQRERDRLDQMQTELQQVEASLAGLD
jgi:valyl-tRNA synthetase